MPTLMLRETLISFDSRVEEYVVPKHIKNVADRCFSERWEMERLTLPEELETLGSYAFRKCINLRQIDMPTHVDSLGKGLFLECRKLHAISIPDGAKEIDFEMFQRCDALHEITLPESVETIHPSAFTTCDQLEYLFVSPAVFALLPSSVQGVAVLSYMGKPDFYPSAVFDSFAEVHGDELMKQAISRRDVPAIRYMLQKEFIPRKLIPNYLEEANRRKQTEVAAVLLEYQQENPEKDAFDWDPFAGL